MGNLNQQNANVLNIEELKGKESVSVLTWLRRNLNDAYKQKTLFCTANASIFKKLNAQLVAPKGMWKL